MDLEKLKEEIRKEEGTKFEVYKDHLGNLTYGVGHLVRDYEKLELGDIISHKKVEKTLEIDLNLAIRDMRKFTKNMNISEDVKEIVTHMSFQLGLPRLNKFVKFKEALKNNKYEQASLEMQDSLWYNQTSHRASRLIQKMKKLT
jgi:GH24 family phage-related lysozyme (muramidase)|tara:strand:- start:301 stop:732 length:432 start_codon:yes stop_codon:yes gene_type:complete